MNKWMILAVISSLAIILTGCAGNDAYMEIKDTHPSGQSVSNTTYATEITLFPADSKTSKLVFPDFVLMESADDTVLCRVGDDGASLVFDSKQQKGAASFPLDDRKIEYWNELYTSVQYFGVCGDMTDESVRLTIGHDGYTDCIGYSNAADVALDAVVMELETMYSECDINSSTMSDLVWPTEKELSAPSSVEPLQISEKDIPILHMPEYVRLSGCYSQEVVVCSEGEDKLRFTIDGMSKEEGVLVTLSKNQILELNVLFEGVTDFSQSQLLDSTSTVYIKHNGVEYSFGEGCARSYMLNMYVDKVFSYIPSVMKE